MTNAVLAGGFEEALRAEPMNAFAYSGVGIGYLRSKEPFRMIGALPSCFVKSLPVLGLRGLPWNSREPSPETVPTVSALSPPPASPPLSAPLPSFSPAFPILSSIYPGCLRPTPLPPFQISPYLPDSPPFQVCGRLSLVPPALWREPSALLR